VRNRTDRLKEPIGKQDQYIAAYGGITCFKFLENGKVEAWPQNVATRISRRSGFAWRFITRWRGSADLVPAPASQPISDSSWSADDRKAASDQLLDYFGKTAPRLLRPAEGTLVHPSIACSLPGKQYATNLWDWDTYWTTRGLFRFAAISNDSAFREEGGRSCHRQLHEFLRSPVRRRPHPHAD
jgi:hypothetical protein